MSTDHAFPPPTPDELVTTPSDAAATRSGARRGLTIGLAAGLLGGTAVGLVFGVPGLTNAAGGSATISAVAEQTTEPTTEPSTEPSTEPTTEPTEPTEPGAPAPDPADPADSADRADRTVRVRERLQPLVDDGTITAEQADAVAAQLVETGPMLGKGRGPGGGVGGHGRGLFGRGAGVVSEAVTDLFGLELDELRTQLREGSTLAEIATAQGIDPQTVIDELVGEVQARLDAAVDKGYLDQATADEKLADAQTWITDVVNNGAMPRHERPDATDATDTTETTESQD